MGWAFIVVGGVEKEGFVMWVGVLKHSIDSRSSGNVCIFPCLRPDA